MRNTLHGRRVPPARTQHETDPVVEFVTETASTTRIVTRTFWQYRLELGIPALLVGLAYFAKVGPRIISWPLLAITLIGLFFARRLLLRWWHSAQVKRAWHRATRDCGLNDRCRKVHQYSAGDRLDVRVRRGRSARGLEQRADELAACLQVADIRVERDRDDASKVTVWLIRHDPFENAPPFPWPGLSGSSVSVWDKEIIGIRDDGSPIRLKLVGNQILVGGTTGAGKSVFLRVLLGIAALSQDPVKVWLFDAKRLELSPWKRIAEEFVGKDGKRAVEVLEHIERIGDSRQQEIEAIGADKISRKSGLPVHVVYVDELGRYAALKEGPRILELLESIASQGRALGIVVIVATQYPHSNIIPTTLRGQFKTIVGFRVRDRHHGGTVFGQSDVAQLASEIPDFLPGVGYTLDETGRVARFRSVFIGRPDDDDPDRADDVLAVVDQAVRMRGYQAPSEPVPTGTEVNPPTGGEGSTGGGTGSGSAGSAGRRDVLGDVKAATMEHLSESPLTGQEVAVRLGRHPDDKTVRKALTALGQEGLAEHTDAGWVRSDGPSSPPSPDEDR